MPAAACKDKETEEVTEPREEASVEEETEEPEKEEEPETEEPEEVQEEKPSFVYEAPETLTDNVRDYIFRLDDQIYELPVPVSEFIAHGWETTALPETMAGDKYISAGFKMKKGDSNIWCNIANPTEKEIKGEEALVTGFFVSDIMAKGIDFELSGGIKIGLNPEELEGKINVSEFEVDENTDFNTKTYTYNERPEYIDFSFEDGILTDISIQKNR